MSRFPGCTPRQNNTFLRECLVEAAVSASLPLRPDQVDAMNRAFKQACGRMGLTGSTPIIELVAVRIVELAHAGEFDPDKLSDIVSNEFNA
jgi:hypothetical protein